MDLLMVSSQVEDVFGPSWSLLLSITEWASFVLNELEFILIQQEELPTLLAVFQQDLGSNVDEVANR